MAAAVFAWTAAVAMLGEGKGRLRWFPIGVLYLGVERRDPGPSRQLWTSPLPSKPIEAAAQV